MIRITTLAGHVLREPAYESCSLTRNMTKPLSVCLEPYSKHLSFDHMDSTLNPTRSTTFVIDSRDRDLTRFPLASHYEISLDEPVHDVVSMMLLVADVPFATYLVQPTNSSIQAILSSGTIINANIPVGDYTGATLAAAVQSALQSQTSSPTSFTASYSTPLDNISIMCNTAFSLVFGKTGTIALELGFAVGSATVSTLTGSTYTVAPLYRRNQHLNPYVILSIVPSCVITSINQNVNQGFAIITPSRSILSVTGEKLPRKLFNPPIARFSRFVIDFCNYDGSSVDFQNHDHRLEMLLISLRAAKYMPFAGLPTDQLSSRNA